MYLGKQRDEWERHAALMALTFNAHRSRKQAARDARHFNRYPHVETLADRLPKIRVSCNAMADAMFRKP